MGGIVLKKLSVIFPSDMNSRLMGRYAIVTALIKHKLYGEIQNCCAGIIFLATPHRGSKETACPAVIASIANFATMPSDRFAGRARSDLIAMLKRHTAIPE